MHNLGREELYCVHCDFSTSFRYNLEGHLRSVHADRDPLFGCSECGVMFNKVETLRWHEEKDHKKIKREPVDEEEEEDEWIDVEE